METKRRKKPSAPRQREDNSVRVRISPRAPRAQTGPTKSAGTPPVARAQNLATALLEGVIGQFADYVENSHAVEKLIRVQAARVLKEFARDPELAGLVRTQVEQYLAELTAHPEILEPLVRRQVDLYLDHLKDDPARLGALKRRLEQEETAPKRRKKQSAKTEIKIE